MFVAETNQRPSVALPVALIVAVSAAAVCFLLWLLYLHHPLDASVARLRFLPLLNAVLNGLCTVALLTGFYFIRRRNIPAHRVSMIVAFVFSSLFLVSYITNHALHGETHFPRLWHGEDDLHFDSDQSRCAIGGGTADGADYFLFLPQRPLPSASQDRALYAANLALRLRDWGRGVRHARCMAVS